MRKPVRRADVLAVQPPGTWVHASRARGPARGRSRGLAGAVVQYGFVLMPNDGGELPITRALGDVRMKALNAESRNRPESQVRRFQAPGMRPSLRRASVG